MYSRKSVGPRIALLTPALTGYFCEQLLRKEEIRPNI